MDTTTKTNLDSWNNNVFEELYPGWIGLKENKEYSELVKIKKNRAKHWNKSALTRNIIRAANHPLREEVERLASAGILDREEELFMNKFLSDY